MVHIIENPPIPLATPIYEGMRSESSIEIHGDVFQGPQGGFTVELPTKNGVALHISVRMGLYGQNVIVFNHLERGRWHREDHHHNNIHFGRPFCMKIHNEHRKYSIHVDGHHIGHYHHHKCPKKIVALTIRGDIRVGKIHFENFKHHNGGGTEVVMPVAVAPTPIAVAPAPVVVAQAPPPILVPPPQIVPVVQPVMQPVVQPMYPSIQPIVYPTATPVIYTQPEVIYMDGYHHHHHGHHY
uniref:Galectin n=1 Tax=Caenorhabditis tropicalis TaxID=1561998 RepID=A0A1I7UNR2_9PELO